MLIGGKFFTQQSNFLHYLAQLTLSQTLSFRVCLRLCQKVHDARVSVFVFV